MLSSCTVNTGAGISNVDPYHLNPTYRPKTDEAMIDFEYRRKLLGAVDNDDKHERWGNYFTIFWKVDDRSAPATIQLHYRQAQSGPQIFLREKTVASPERKNTTKFTIIGDEYAEGGAVTQWKATIVQNGSVVDEFESYLWQE